MPDTIVYLAWWDNGWEYNDHRLDLIGVYATNESALKAGLEYHEKMMAQGFGVYRHAYFYTNAHKVQP
ncbi:MAG: hypothetical protein M1281_02830 [Chloroflexi bacterium]|nr:hypothetical protein [Chloroflexota bacterium]